MQNPENARNHGIFPIGLMQKVMEKDGEKVWAKSGKVFHMASKNIFLMCFFFHCV